MKKNLITCLLVVLFVGFSVSSFASVPPKTDYPVLGPIEAMKPNGDFFIYVRQGDQWQQVGKISYDMFFREQSIDLNSFLKDQAGFQVRLVQRGGGAAHIDSVFLGEKPPERANSPDEKTYKSKLSKRDFDVIDAYGKAIDLVFGSGIQNKTLSLTARVEGEEISKIPFQFPVANNYSRINKKSDVYRYRLDFYRYRVTSKNSTASTQWKPFFAEFCETGSGHPYGYTYGWVWNDDKYLYVKLDFTPDNTMDGSKDYAAVYVNTGKRLKEFRITINDTRWGDPEFTYTDKVDYQHKLYHFRIPLREIDPVENQVMLAFATYGTATPPVEGSIHVGKQTIPDGAPDSFTFTGDVFGSLKDNEGGGLNKPPGTYTSKETVPSGWTLTSIVCDDGNSSGDKGTAIATFQLEAGERVTCVFTNTKDSPPEPPPGPSPTNPALKITKTAHKKNIFAGETATFKIEVRNTGDVALTDIVISDPLVPACEHRLNQLAPGDKVSYECETDPLFEDLTNEVKVTAQSPSGEIEESDEEFVNIQIFDWGDAPQGTPLNPLYPTAFSTDGARHKIKKIPELYLGLGVDSDPDGQPNIDATGDDNDGNDDEDGVVFNTPLVAGQQAQITVTAFDKGVLPGFLAGKLDAWVDYNDDGDWDDPGEQIFNNRVLVVGDNPLTFTVPASAATVSPTYARFRFSSAGVLLPYRAAPDGEVEDYRVNIQAP